MPHEQKKNENDAKGAFLSAVKPELKEKLAELIDKHWSELGFGGKCLSVLGGVFSAAVAAPVSLISEAFDTVKVTGEDLVVTVKDVPGSVGRHYTSGKKQISSLCGVETAGEGWEAQHAKLGWAKRGLACLMGCLYVVVGVPADLIRGIFKAAITLVSRVVALPFRMLTNMLNAYNAAGVGIMYSMSKTENTVEFIEEFVSTKPETTCRILGIGEADRRELVHMIDEVIAKVQGQIASA